MRHFFFLLLIFAGFSIVQAQKISIDGKVESNLQKPLDNVTVFLLKQKDSAIINYTSTSKEGNFSLKLDPVLEPSILRIEADQYRHYSKNFEKIDKTIDLGKIVLEKDSVFNIKEVVISASPVKIKKDTIEFSANAIKVRPDSKVEELLKQIPGIEIGNDGKITAIGKEVDQIMINGKPFFDKDGKIALQNLPADLIKNIQITTTKTKEEETSGKTAKSNNATINLTIDDKKNKGLISRITAGYGTNDRYEGSALISYFNKDTKISVLGSSNNINSQGFSSDEIFDSMGQGRNSWIMQGNSVVTRGRSTYYSSGGTTKGIQKSTVVGVNYSDKLAKEVDLQSMNAIYLNNNLETRSKVSRTTLLPDYKLQTNSENSGENENRQMNFDTSFQIKPDSVTTIHIAPSFSRSEGFSVNQNKSVSSRDLQLLNNNDSYQKNILDNNNFSSNIYFSRKLSKKGRRVNASVSNSFNSSKNENLTNSQTFFYQNLQQDNRNQLSDKRNINNEGQYSLGYTEPITDSIDVSFQMEFNHRNERDFRNVNDFDAATGNYTSLNNLLSNDMSQKVQDWSPEISFSINKKKYNFWSSAAVKMSDMEVNSKYNNQTYDLQKNYLLPNYSFNLQYNFTERKRLSIYHYGDFDLPTATQLTPYEDLSNPLITYKGNPDLKPTWRSSVYAYMNNFDMLKNINYYMNLGFTYYENSISNFSLYDASGKQFVTYTNISGNKNVNFGFGLTKTYKWKENKFSINPRFFSYYSYNRGFMEGKVYTGQSYNLNPGINLTYELKDKITIKPSYSLGYNATNYTNFSIDKMSNSNQQLKLELTNYFLKTNLVFGNDFQYNTNSNIASGFKRDFYFWNTSLGYSFFKKQLTAKVKVYDVLNQNQSVTRYITSSYIEDRDDLILKRYVMFSLTMKLNKFAGNKK